MKRIVCVCASDERSRASRNPGKRRLASLLITSTILGSASLYVPVAAYAQQPPASQTVSFNIPPQPLSSAIAAFIRITGWEVGFTSQAVAGKHSAPVTGSMPPAQALQAMLAGTGVSVDISGPSTAALVDRVSQAFDIPDDGSLVLDVIDVTGGGRFASTGSGFQGTPDWVYETPRSISVIGRDSMDRTPPRHAADIIENTPGVYSMLSQQDPALSVNIRGIQDFGRVNMMIDGARQNFQKSGHGQRHGTMYVDPELLTAVDITKGPDSGRYGAGVIGGTANFRTLTAADVITDPDKGWGVRLNGTTGTNGNHFTGSAAAAFENETWNFLAATSYRNQGEYEPGKNGSLPFNMIHPDDGGQMIMNSPVKFSSQEMRSYLVKLGLTPTPDHSLGFTYLRNESSYEMAGMINATTFATPDNIWSKTGDAATRSQLFMLDYNYDPVSPLVDFDAKAYFNSTRLDESRPEYVNPPSSIYDPATFCEPAANGLIPTWKLSYCAPAYDMRYQTDTWGLNLNNVSTFSFENSGLSIAQGFEFFHDITKPRANVGVMPGFEEDIVTPLEGSTPHGKRAMASANLQATWEYDDWLRLDAGLRYDHYWLSGYASIDAISRQVSPPQPLLMEFDVDDNYGHLMPTLAVAVKPGVEWAQLYANWGRGWRPPAISETFMSGRHVGGGSGQYFPNPYLKPEKSETYEIGVNFSKDSVFTPEDRFRAKIAFFDTRVDNFIFIKSNIVKPYDWLPVANYSTHMNSENSVKFRGIEFDANYDAGTWFIGGSYTMMLGENRFCGKLYHLGYRGPNTDPEFIESANAAVQCGGFTSAEHMPMDRASLVAGVRFFDQRLEIGGRVKWSEGFIEEVQQGNVFPMIWPEYTVVDLFGSYKFNDNATARFSVENLFDKPYIVPMGDPLASTLNPGRTFRASLSVTF